MAREFEINGREYLKRVEEFRPASVHETLGPNFKDIHWIVNDRGERIRPMVKKEK